MEFKFLSRYFSNIGFYGWVLQRLSAIIIFLYCIFLFYYIVFCKNLDYYYFVNLIFNERLDSVKVVISVFVINLYIHAWVGLWVILTDYINIISLRFFLQTLINLLFLFSLILLICNL